MSDDTTILAKLCAMEEALQALAPLLEKIVAVLEVQGPPPAPLPPVASYAQLYPQMVEPR